MGILRKVVGLAFGEAGEGVKNEVKDIASSKKDEIKQKQAEKKNELFKEKAKPYVDYAIDNVDVIVDKAKQFLNETVDLNEEFNNTKKSFFGGKKAELERKLINNLKYLYLFRDYFVILKNMTRNISDYKDYFFVKRFTKYFDGVDVLEQEENELIEDDTAGFLFLDYLDKYNAQIYNDHALPNVEEAINLFVREVKQTKKVEVSNEVNNKFVYCNNCGTKIDVNTKFCPECGCKNEVTTNKFCPECGAKIDNNAKFCPECGNKL
jgi:RNA polymerase subunit RPABC4/transcription elongation factor Spt4